MRLVEDYMKQIDINDLKEHIKSELTKYNTRLDDECLKCLLTFIDNSEIRFTDDTNSFVKIDDDKYGVYSYIWLYQFGDEEPFIPALYDIFQDVKALRCYRSGNTKDGRIHVLHFNYAFKFLCNYRRFISAETFTLKELVDYADEYCNGYCDNIIEFTGEEKGIAKVICTPKYISVYKIDFGNHGVYIGQTKNVKTRMSGHKSQASKGKHCYVLNELYKNDLDTFIKALKNVQILDRPIYLDAKKNKNIITPIEYSYQIEALRNGEKLLGRQCWDDDFRWYLGQNVDEYEYQELLAKSYQINKDPNNSNGYSTRNYFAKNIGNRIMNYEDVVKYFETLKADR